MFLIQFRYVIVLAAFLMACAPRVIRSADSEVSAQEEPKLSKGEIREFLLNAKIIQFKITSKGITLPSRLTLTDGKITHDAGFQTIDERKNKQEFPDGTFKINFVDSYLYNIAAFELAKLLGLGDMVPVTVEPTYQGKKGSISWWLPAVMDEATRYNKKISPPDVEAWNRQMYRKRIFAELVYDTDPNLTNVLISKDWHLWMIDFTRAFRWHTDLRTPSDLKDAMIGRQLLENLRNLKGSVLMQKTKGYLTKQEVDGVMARRDKIVKIFDGLIAQKGEKAVVHDDLINRVP
jgi:hypothetical protein